MPALDVRGLLKQARDKKSKASVGSSAFDTAGSKAAESIKARILDPVPVSAEHALANDHSVCLLSSSAAVNALSHPG